MPLRSNSIVSMSRPSIPLNRQLKHLEPMVLGNGFLFIYMRRLVFGHKQNLVQSQLLAYLVRNNEMGIVNRVKFPPKIPTCLRFFSLISGSNSTLVKGVNNSIAIG